MSFYYLKKAAPCLWWFGGQSGGVVERSLGLCLRCSCYLLLRTKVTPKGSGLKQKPLFCSIWAGLEGNSSSLLCVASGGEAGPGMEHLCSRGATHILMSWCWLTSWDGSWASFSLHVGLSAGCLGFLTAWWLDSKCEHPKRTRWRLSHLL